MPGGVEQDPGMCLRLVGLHPATRFPLSRPE